MIHPPFLRFTLLLAAFLGAVAQAAPVPQNADSVKAKLALLPLVAASYGQTCSRGKGGQTGAAGSGSPISLSPAGVATWGSHTDDLAHSYTNDFSVITGPGDLIFNAKISDPVSGVALAQYGTTLHQAMNTAMVTLGDDSATAVSGSCAGSARPPGLGKPLWPVAVQLLGFDAQGADCMDLKARAKVQANIAFTADRLVVGPYTFLASAARGMETVTVNDAEPQIAYSFSTPDNTLVILSIDPASKRRKVQVSPAGNPMQSFACRRG